MKRRLLLVACVSLSGCAAHYAPGVVADPYGFWSGIWHGLIFPYALLVNVFSWLAGLLGLSLMDSIQLVGRPNTGFGYYLGYGLGLLSYGGGAIR